MKFLEDTMLMSYVLDAGKNKHNMDELSKIHLNHQTISYKDLVGTGKKQITFDDVDIDQAKDYAAEDADVTYRLYKKFLKDIKEEKLVNIYESFEKPMIEILMPTIEYAENGFPVTELVAYYMGIADDNFNNYPNYVNQSNYRYPNNNFAIFGENIFYLNNK